MSILVTGGAGFIGSHIVRTLKQNGRNVIVLDRVNYNYHDVASIITDVNDLDRLNKIFKSYDFPTVIHLVGLPSIGECEENPQLSFKLNTMSVQNVLEAMRMADVDRIIFASSACVYGYYAKEKVSEKDPPRPDTVYGLHKLFSEELIKMYHAKYGIDFVILRPFNVYGANPKNGKDVISIFIKRMLDGKPLIVKGPNKFRDFIYIDDVAHAFCEACFNNFSNVTVNLGSGIKTSLHQLASIFKSLRSDVEIIEEVTPDDGTGLYADITLAREMFNFTPTALKDGISKILKIYGMRSE